MNPGSRFLVPRHHKGGIPAQYTAEWAEKQKIGLFFHKSHICDVLDLKTHFRTVYFA